MDYETKHDDGDKTYSGLRPSMSVEEGQVNYGETTNGGLHRTLSPRMVHVISLGSSIGSGLFITTGPANMFLAYLVVCVGMTIAFPTSGNYIDYADRWVDPALAFGAGFAEWLGWTSVFASEAMFVVTLVNYWADGVVPEAALPISLAVIAGAGPSGYVRHGSTWLPLPDRYGFSTATLLAIWAVGDQVFIGVMAGEAESPHYSMARSANFVPWRVGIFYLVSVVLISLVVDSDDSRLMNGSSVVSSPFVIAAQDAGISGVPDLINACIILGILALSLECIYLPSRILRTMSLQGLLPVFIAKVDRIGRPRWALTLTAVAGTVLTYLSLSADGTEVLNWFISITSASFFTNWAIIAFSSFRFRAAIRAQRSQLFEAPYAWRSLYWPLAPVISLFVSALLLVCLLYTSIKPVGGGAFTAYSFFSATIGLIVIIVFTIGYKIVHRTPWRDPATADLITGHRELTAAELRCAGLCFNADAEDRASLSELIQIDKHYLSRITLRTKLIQDKRASVLGASPRSIPAVKELYYFLMNDYLPQRYSTIFQRVSTTTSTSASAPTTSMLRNTVTGETIPTTPPTDAKEALAIIGRQVEEDFLLLLPPQPSSIQDDDKKEGTNKQMTLEAFIGCFPNGFNWAEKFRKSLANIHVPWTVSVDGVLHAASSMHLYEGEEVVELEELDVDTMLFRLPISNAVVFVVRTYMYPLQDIKKEGNGPRLVEAIAGLKEGSSPGFHFYKRAAVWQKAVSEYLLDGELEVVVALVIYSITILASFHLRHLLNHHVQIAIARAAIIPPEHHPEPDPQILAITTPKGSPLRYLCIPVMIWILSLVLHPVKNPWHVTSLFATTAWFNILSALDLLLLNPKEADNFVTINKGTSRVKVKSFFYGLRTALKLRVNSRKINTPEEAKNTPPMPGYYTQGNGRDASKAISRRRNEEPQPQPQSTFVEGSWVALWIEQTIVAIVAWFIVGRIVIGFNYRLVAVVGVGLRLEAPEGFPP
ncbi:proline-specific permease [Aspergillus vadensis CBS 113365]|uniref:Proline-specific permease n=1 Tax=Aspergillus vadensis (strain CBS 113365 / IMI 142717 / IBT 24658) TaxID=1448311 RepID=A0A319CLC3_ASPVC|nr:proline-specific permease [Aspergillus vadensis CBS 113365]PYH69122.1 proline-specific permease [Aspergillus vadensis CBS 113365]